jgi:hypothetical protein
LQQSKNELNGFLGRIDFFLAEVEKTIAPETVLADGAMTERIDHDPLGVVANVSAWNYPYFVGGNVFVPALLTGNAVLYKPSEFATLTGLHVERLLHAAGIPEDVFVVVVGAGDVGAALLAQPVDGVFFTGSVATGRRSQRRWARAWCACSSSSAARTRPTSPTTPTRRRPPSRSPTARCTTPARAAARSSASTSTRGSTTSSSATSSPPSRASGSAIRSPTAATSAR